MTIEALLFDMGNVVIRISFKQMLAAFDREDLTESDAARLVENWQFHDQYERGKISEHEFLSQVAKALGLSWSQDRLRTAWNSIYQGEVPGINALLARLGQAMPLYLLSNTNPIHFDYCDAHFPSLKHFTHRFLSYELNARKPEPAIYEAILKMTGKPAANILFFDDVLKNVTAAREIGLKAEVVFQSAAEIEAHVLAHAPIALRQKQ